MAVLTTDARNALPDSAFACVEGSGDTKTRLYPHHHADGSIDLPHLRNALARVADQSNSSCGKAHLEAHAAALKLGDRGKEHEGMEVKSISDFELKDDGEVLVAFARFNEIDHDKDVTYPGAFPEGKSVPMSDYGHTSWGSRGARLPVGKGVIATDGDLALFKGRFFLKTRPGQDAYETVKEMGDEQEWSYGYDVLDFVPRPKEFPGARRGLKSVNPFEVSPVLMGSGKSTATIGLKDVDGDLLVGSFTEQADRVLEACKELGVRERDIVDLRLKEGRKLSSDRRKRIEEQLAILRELVAGHTALLAETEVAPKADEADPPKERRVFTHRSEAVKRGYALSI